MPGKIAWAPGGRGPGKFRGVGPSGEIDRVGPRENRDGPGESARGLRGCGEKIRVGPGEAWLPKEIAWACGEIGPGAPAPPPLPGENPASEERRGKIPVICRERPPGEIRGLGESLRGYPWAPEVRGPREIAWAPRENRVN